MNMSVTTSPTRSAIAPVGGSHTILLLSGILFGMCVSSALPQETKLWFVLAGTTGLLAYLGLTVAARRVIETQQREASIQAELRLQRHAQHESRHDWTAMTDDSSDQLSNRSGMIGVAPGCEATNAPN